MVGVDEVTILPAPSSYSISASLTLIVSPIEYPEPASETATAVTAPPETVIFAVAAVPPVPVEIVATLNCDPAPVIRVAGVRVTPLPTVIPLTVYSNPLGTTKAPTVTCAPAYPVSPNTSPT